MSIPTFVSTLPGSTRQFLGNIFHKKNNGLRAQQQQSQAPSSNDPTSNSTNNNNNNNNNNHNNNNNNNNNNDDDDINDSITANNNSIRNEKVAGTPLLISSTFLEKYPSTLSSNNTPRFSVLLPPVSILADNFDYNYHSHRTSNASRGAGTGTPLSESTPPMPIPPPRRSSIGTNTSSSSANSATTPSITGIADSGSGTATALTHAYVGPKNPSPLSPRGDNNTFTQGHVTVTFTKFVTTPTIPTPALTVSTAPTITASNNSNSGFDSFIVNKDDSTEDIALDMEAMSPTSRKKKFDHFPFRRSGTAATATSGGSGSGGGVGAGSILSNLASTFKTQHNYNNASNSKNNNNNNSNNNHSLSKLSLGFTRQQQQQQQTQQQRQHQKMKWQQEQHQSHSQPPQQQQQTLKSPRSQLFFIAGRNKKESVRPSTFNKLSSKRFSSSSPSLIPDVPSLPATDTKSSTTTTTITTTPTTKSSASRISSITSPTRATAALKKKRLSKNQANTTTSAATATPALIPAPAPAPAPVTVTESDLVPSPLSMMHWPILPEVVVIRDLPEYIPDDSIGLNAKRNEKYARTRLVALREHQQILVGLLADLLALDQQRREQQSVYKDPAHSVEKATVTAAPRKNTPSLMSASQAAVLTTSSSKDPKGAEAGAGVDCGCDCQKRRRRLIQKHDSAIRAYQQAILDLWQTDQNLCHWLSRYIRTIRHIGRGLGYMLTAMAENNNSSSNNNNSTVSASTSSPFKYPVALGMTQEIGRGGRGIDVETSGNDRPSSSVSGVSNPELERMGILQSRLLGHSTTNLSLKDSGIGGSQYQPQPPMFRATVSKEFTMESTTLGLIETGSPSMRPSEQTVPTIKVNSPELLFKPLPKLPENNDTISSSHRNSTNSFAPSFIAANSFPRGLVGTMRRTGPIRANRLVTGPILSQAIRELVTSSAPIAPPPAIPAPKRPKPPTFPINIPSSTRANAAVGIVSNSFFPSVPSPPASARIAYSRTRPSYPIHPGFSASVAATSSGAGDARSSDSVRSPISSLAPILELDQSDQQSQSPSLLRPCESESSRNSVTSGADTTVFNTHTKNVKDDIKHRSAIATTTTTTTTTTPAPAPASTTSTTTMPKSTTQTDSATAQAMMMIPDTDDYNEIEASVFVGYHLQSLSKANEFLLQFNKESRRSYTVLQRFEVAKRAFERHVLGLGLGFSGAGVGGGEDSDGEMSGQHW